MKQTAVEWLGFELNLRLFDKVSEKEWEEINEVFKKALAMEREQMIRFAENYEEYAYNKSENNRYVSPKTPDQYYNETYGGEQ